MAYFLKDLLGGFGKFILGLLIAIFSIWLMEIGTWWGFLIVWSPTIIMIVGWFMSNKDKEFVYLEDWQKLLVIVMLIFPPLFLIGLLIAIG